MLVELDDYDWEQAFADESYGNTDKTIEVAPPNADVSYAPFGREDVVRVVAMSKEEGDYAEVSVIGVFELRDGRFAVVGGWCDTTGWDCQAGNRMVVCASELDAVRFGLDDDDRRKLFPGNTA